MSQSQTLAERLQKPSPLLAPGVYDALTALVAQQGEMQGRQSVSKAWLADCASHGPQDAQVRYGTMRADMGYKNFFWHPRPGGAWLRTPALVLGMAWYRLRDMLG